MDHHELGVEVDRQCRERPAYIQETAGLGREREADREKRITAIPRRSRGIRRCKAVLRLAAVLIDLDRANADRKTRALALAFPRIEFAIDEYDTRASDLAQLSLPFSKTSQIS